MSKKLKRDEKSLLILVIVALVIIGIYFTVNLYTNYKNKKEKNKNQDVKYIFNNFQNDNIYFIQIENFKNKYEIVLKKEDGKWKFIKPEGLRTNNDSVNSYLVSAKYLTWIAKVDKKDIDESLFGFDKPEMIIKFSGNVQDTSISYNITIGGKSPIGDRYYIRKNNDNTIYVIDGLTHDSLMAKIDDMRNRKIFTEIPRQEIGYVEFQNFIDNIDNLFYYFNNNWIWKFKNIEKAYKGNSLPAKTLLDRLSGFGIDKFYKNIPKYDKPDYKIIIKSMDGKKQEVFDIIESDENLPPEQKKVSIINKNTNEAYQATLRTIYTYFTEKPYKFFQEAK